MQASLVPQLNSSIMGIRAVMWGQHGRLWGHVHFIPWALGSRGQRLTRGEAGSLVLEGEDRKGGDQRGGCTRSVTSRAHSAFRKHRGNRAVPAPWPDGCHPEEVLSLPLLG